MTDPTKEHVVAHQRSNEDLNPLARDNQLGKDQPDKGVFAPDALTIPRTFIAMAVAFFGGGLLSLAAWFVLKQTSLPAFGGSFVTRALSTASVVIVIVAVAVLVYFHAMNNRRNVSGPRWLRGLTYFFAYFSPAMLVVSALGIPLSSTRLYLDGVAVDQGFRTQYMTHFANTASLTDMNYADLPAYYPALWFWLGGRFANVFDLEGWEAYQPWSIVTISAAACLLVPVWQRLTGSVVVASAIALTTTAIGLVMSADEPYALIIVLGAPAAIIVSRRGLYGDKIAMIGSAVYLGIAACMYTLYTGVIAVSVVVLAALIAVVVFRNIKPLVHLLVIGLSSLAIAATVWGPYVLAVLSGEHTSGATATHYLPMEGTQVPLPMFAASLVGLLCLVGVIHILLRLSDKDVRALGVALIVVYGWVIASMVFTLAGQTLLGFRLDVVITVILATSGLLGLAHYRLEGIRRLYPTTFSEKTSQVVTAALVVVCALAGIQYAQQITYRNAHSYDLAFTETDGFGERADRYPADAGQYYAQVDEEIRSHGYDPAETVILTSEKDFMSFYPYRGFQAITSHYANPLGEFDERNATIEEWAKYSYSDNATPEEFTRLLDDAKWRAPQVFVLAGSMSEESVEAGWNFDIAEDIYPNNPNVRFRGVKFNPEMFQSSDWEIQEIGPFVVISRV